MIFQMSADKLRNRITVTRGSIKWANKLVKENHYLKRPVHSRADPFAYEIMLDKRVIGTIIMATPHFTKKKDLFGYCGLPTKWQTLIISRVWLYPDIQGQRIVDSQGNMHSVAIASCALGKMLRRVQRDWLEHHPPKFPDDPYHIRLILAYADLSVGHEGIIYKAANFQYWDTTKNKKPRHSTRGGHDGGEKKLYIYHLPEPRFTPVMQLPLLLNLQEVPA